MPGTGDRPSVGDQVGGGEWGHWLLWGIYPAFTGAFLATFSWCISCHIFLEQETAPHPQGMVAHSTLGWEGTHSVKSAAGRKPSRIFSTNIGEIFFLFIDPSPFSSLFPGGNEKEGFKYPTLIRDEHPSKIDKIRTDMQNWGEGGSSKFPRKCPLISYPQRNFVIISKF